MQTGRQTPGYRALRRGRASLEGQPYLVTFVARHRRSVFLDPERASAMVRAQLDPRLWRNSRLLAWVLMPDHWHGLLVPGTGDQLERLVGRLKANTSRAISMARGGINGVWAPGYQDRAIRSDENLLAAARYLVLNPFRAGLVARIDDYPWWGAVWVEGRASGV
jgi:putative transposase